ncbi:MAG: CRISPR-associated endonuclease Cas1 [Ghiorsea sp.]|nr:CRISPR-associated endonuclease Cas1 [Ghiorsea sp.]
MDELPFDESLRSDQAVQIAPYRERGKLLIFCGHVGVLSTGSGCVRFEREHICLLESPWHHVDGIILFGRHNITTPAMLAALNHDVPIHLASNSGHYKGMIYNPRCANTGDIWLAQHRLFACKHASLQAAKSVVESRIRHMRETLRRRNSIALDHARDAMKISLHAVMRADTLSELNGVEGNATRLYFDGLKGLVPAIYGFNDRNRRPPRDPFNALISLGYTQLYAHVDALLRVTGLLPELGFYHQVRSGHAALASDLMEPFRHVVERCALSMLQRGKLKLDDFTFRDSDGCRLNAATRRLYLGHLTEALLMPVKNGENSDALPILDHIYQQCLNLKRWVTGKSDIFEAWRVR